MAVFTFFIFLTFLFGQQKTTLKKSWKGEDIHTYNTQHTKYGHSNYYTESAQNQLKDKKQIIVNVSLQNTIICQTLKKKSEINPFFMKSANKSLAKA